MIVADYMSYMAVFALAFVNRQSLTFLCVFAISELTYHLQTNPVYDSCILATCFALAAYKSARIKYELQMALICYSVLFWFAGFDYLAFPQETIFYVIFPYIVKFIDIFVIYHLINKEQRNVRVDSARHCSFN